MYRRPPSWHGHGPSLECVKVVPLYPRNSAVSAFEDNYGIYGIFRISIPEQRGCSQGYVNVTKPFTEVMITRCS